MKHTAKNIDEYIALYPLEVQVVLQEIRRTIHLAAPQATEKISWGMATFSFHGNLVHFAGATKHIGFYPSPSAIEFFQKELSEYETSKGAIRFPYSKPIPFDLIHKIVEFRVLEQIKKKQPTANDSIEQI